MNVERLRRDGADVSAIAVSADYPTGSAFVRYRGDGSRDFVYNIAKSAASRVSLTAEAKALFARSGHLHVMGTAFSIPNVWDMLEHAIGVIKERGGSVSVDPNLRKELLNQGQTRERFAKLLDAADLVLPSGDELSIATGLPAEADALAALFARKVGEVVVKRGEGGSSLFRADGTRVDSPAFIVTEVDPTGAGDCFGGAYVACRRLGMPAETAQLRQRGRRPQCDAARADGGSGHARGARSFHRRDAPAAPVIQVLRTLAISLSFILVSRR